MKKRLLAKELSAETNNVGKQLVCAVAFFI